MPDQGVRVEDVDPDGPAHRAGIRPKDRLVSIDGEPLRDAIDLAFLADDEEVEVEYLKPDGRRVAALLRRAFCEPLGLALEDIAPRSCRNRCVFCFVDQNPPGLRKTLYVKDDDPRLSFVHGSYITLTDLDHDDIERIVDQQLSPLYVSVHATDPALRARMMGYDAKRAHPMLPLLADLGDAGIRFHTQIVLCPGLNDGAALDRTLDELARLGESIESVAIVPVGLTAHRRELPRLEAVTPKQARGLIDHLAPLQEGMRRERGTRWVLLSDEFYLLADRPLPHYTDDEVRCQIENGVGMVAAFYEDWDRTEEELPERVAPVRHIALLTGVLGARVLEPVVDRLNEVAGLSTRCLVVENRLFGPPVTVSGLLGGEDFARTIAAHADTLDLAILPENALRAQGDLFLDDLSLAALRRRFPNVRIETAGMDAAELARLAAEPIRAPKDARK